jgi:hypothetical protein
MLGGPGALLHRGEVTFHDFGELSGSVDVHKQSDEDQSFGSDTLGRL